MRSSAVALTVLILAALASAAPGTPALTRVDALPIAALWTKTIDGPAPVAAAAAAGRLLAGWADHFDVFALDTGTRDWGLPVPATRAACEASLCVVVDGSTLRGIDLDRRAIRWEHRLDAPPAGTPVVRSGWVLAASATGVIRAFQASDGREIWRAETGSAPVGAPSINGNQFALATTAPDVRLLDLQTGRALWTAPLELVPGPARLGGGAVSFGTDDGRLVVLDDATGRVRFVQRTGANITDVPALDETHFYTVGLDGVLRAFDRGNGALRWYKNLETRAIAGPALDGDLIFVALRSGAIDVRLNDGRAAARLAPAGPEPTLRLAAAPVISGAGASLTLVMLTSDGSDTSKWTLTGYRGGAPVAPSARPPVIPGHALTLTAPR